MPEELVLSLKESPKAQRFFEQLPPSAQEPFILWVARPTGKQREDAGLRNRRRFSAAANDWVFAKRFPSRNEPWRLVDTGKIACLIPPPVRGC